MQRYVCIYEYILYTYISLLRAHTLSFEVCAKTRGAEPICIPIAVEIQAEAAHVQCSLGNGATMLVGTHFQPNVIQIYVLYIYRDMGYGICNIIYIIYS